jgi:uncharacterized ferritin-like protein (DUF455 family)
MVKVSMGVENGDGASGLKLDPRECIYARIDDELLFVDRDKIAVGLIGPHGAGFNLHRLYFLMDFYTTVLDALRSDQIDHKETAVAACLAHCIQNDPTPPSGFVAVKLEAPSYASFCTIVPPRKLPARRRLDSSRGLAVLLHAICHIEYSAIDLALDAVYRYPQMPQAFRADWLEVAQDEIRHYRMLSELLDTLGYRHGDFPVHAGLFEASQHTAESVLDRMAVIPRFYEAGGLDVNPQIIAKLQHLKSDPLIPRIIRALETILVEEIDHVAKGDRWFRWLCVQRGVESDVTYWEILDRYRLDARARPHINVSARQEAGFSSEELQRLIASKASPQKN